MRSNKSWKWITIWLRYIASKYFPIGTRHRDIADEITERLGINIDLGLPTVLSSILRRFHRIIIPRNFFDLNRDEQYQIWLRNNKLDEDEIKLICKAITDFTYKPKISIVMPVYNTEEQCLKLAINSVFQQLYPNWELCIVDDSSTKKDIPTIIREYAEKDTRIKVKSLESNLGIAGASNIGLSMASGDYVGFLDHDDELTRDALYQNVKLLNNDLSLDVIYSDEDKIDTRQRRVEPFFKPDWSPDLLLSMNYVCHFTIIRKSLIEKVEGFRSGFEGSQDYDLFLRVTELTQQIGHIPKPLYGWRKVFGSAASSIKAKPYAYVSAKRALNEAIKRRGIQGEAVETEWKGLFRIKYALKEEPLVTIIIPTKDKANILKTCIDSIEEQTDYQNYEIIVVDSGSVTDEAISYLFSLDHKVLNYNGQFNFSRINNSAVSGANGEYLLFLNNDTKVLQRDWLKELVSVAQREDVGVVGPKLIYPNGLIQHAGTIIGLGGPAGQAFNMVPDGEGYFGLPNIIRNCSSLTAACMITKKKTYEDLGGFDENLAVAYGDVDFCLRLGKAGLLVVYDPFVKLCHHESATRTLTPKAEIKYFMKKWKSLILKNEPYYKANSLTPESDIKYFMKKWKNVVLEGDPYYNPNLTLAKSDYMLTFKETNNRSLSVLLDLYALSSKLRKYYPEVKKGDYRRLIKWAITDGIATDFSKMLLLPYKSYYASNFE
jgi:glycosyltransferase involved in cell wall biosynthesis